MELRRYFITGLVVAVPLYISVYVLTLIVGFMDGLLGLLPPVLQPETYLHFRIPGLGVVFTLVSIFLIGVVTTNFAGKRLLSLGEMLISRVPVVRMVYNASKQFTETVFRKEDGFRKVVLVEFPKKDVYSMGFVTGRPNEEIRSALSQDSVCVFVPTTPNPTTGFFLIVKERDTIPVGMKVEDAFKVFMTAGMVMPESSPGSAYKVQAKDDGDGAKGA